MTQAGCLSSVFPGISDAGYEKIVSTLRTEFENKGLSVITDDKFDTLEGRVDPPIEKPDNARALVLVGDKPEVIAEANDRASDVWGSVDL